MTFIGIDYGTKRIGIALSDDEGKLAFPHTVAVGEDDAIALIVKLAGERGIKKVIVGESKNYKGEDNIVMAATRVFTKRIEKEVGLPTAFEPEMLSTQEARRYVAKGSEVDASAAAIILQSYLDRDKK